MRLQFIAVAALAIAGSGHAQQVYRCPGPNHQTVFQQQPCTGGAAMKLHAGNVVQPVAAPEPVPPKARKDLGMGLDDAEVRARWGQPATINTDVVDGVVRQQYVFRGPGGTTYVYMRDGLSDAVQARPAASSRPRGAGRCYSETEIWNAGIGMNSQSRTEAERASIRRQVERMRACAAD